jgi:hypothetical protein
MNGLHAQSNTATITETADFIGARVFGADGAPFGEVSDVMVVDGHIERMRVKTDRPMGIGEQVVELQRKAFTPSGKVVTLKISGKELRMLAPLHEPEK